MNEREEILYLKKQIKMLWGFVTVLLVVVFIGGFVVLNNHIVLNNERQVVNWCADYLLNDGQSNYKTPVQGNIGSGSNFEDAEQNINYLVD